jgi:hypothetical protein
LVDYMCDGNPSWLPFSVECERAAFMDGFANFIQSVYRWKRNATDAYHGDLWMNKPDPRCPPHNPLVPNINHRLAGCNTRGFWRVFVTRSLGQILSAMDSYPFCVNIAGDNHCENERWMFGPLNGQIAGFVLDPNAQNWKDFWYNWEINGGVNLDPASTWAGLKDGEL